MNFKETKISKPIISIITPYYNGQNYIEETAQSVLNQTFKNFEWIIIDDGSSKEGIDKLDKIKTLDDRIRIIRSGLTTYEIVANKDLVPNARTKRTWSQMPGQKGPGPKCTDLRWQEI